MDSKPIIEISNGHVDEPVTAQNPAGPHIEHSGLPSATDLDSIQGEQVIKKETERPFDIKKYLSGLSLTPEAQEALALLFEKAEILDKLQSNPITNGIIATALKVM